MEHYFSVMGFTKHLELKKQKRRADKEQNKKAHTIGGYNSALGGGGENWFNKATSTPAQYALQLS